jgi:glutathione synthase/RimK-type ligase-like ATP-grasp enzyme
MKKIAVFFKEPGAKDYPFNKPEYWQSYQDFDDEIKKRGGQFFIVRGNVTYLGEGKFSQSWQFADGELKETGPITVDKVFDKGEFISDGEVYVLNAEKVNDICTDKYKTFQMFREFCPETILVQNASELEAALKKIPGEKKVAKPIDGEEGTGVFIGDNDYLKKCSHQFPVLVQAFIDTSAGIPGISKGIHDLRLIFVNGEMVNAYYRTPPLGELLPNIAQGGKLFVIEKEDVPESVYRIANAVRANFEDDYYFCVDVGFNPRGEPKIIELNSRVGLLGKHRGPGFAIFMEKLAEILTK